MSTEVLRNRRATVAGLIKNGRRHDDPELIKARALLHEESLINAVVRALEKSPPLTPQTRERVIALLSTHPAA